MGGWVQKEGKICLRNKSMAPNRLMKVIPAVLFPLIISDTKSWIGIVFTAAVPALLDRILEYKHRDP